MLALARIIDRSEPSFDHDGLIAEQGAGYGYTKCLGYHPLVATRAGTGEILFS